LKIIKAKKTIKGSNNEIPLSLEDQRALKLWFVCHQYSKVKMEIFFFDAHFRQAFLILAPFLKNDQYKLCPERSNGYRPRPSAHQNSQTQMQNKFLKEIEALEDNCRAIASFRGPAVGLEILIE